MKLYDAIVKANRPVLVITEPYKQRAVLKRLGEAHVFKAMQFMHVHDLVEKVLFAYDKRAVFETASFFDKKMHVVEPWLDFLYFINEENAVTETLKELLALKTHLIKKGLIITTAEQALLFKDKAIIVDLDKKDSKINMALEVLETIEPYLEIPNDEPSISQTLQYHFFDDVEREIASVAAEIRDLEMSGVALDSVAVSCGVGEYRPYLKRLFHQFGIPINTQDMRVLWHYQITQRFYDILKSMSGDAFTALSEALELIKPRDGLRLYHKILHAVNPFVEGDEPIEDLLESIRYVLETTPYREGMFKRAVTVTTGMNIDVEQVTHLFAIGCAEAYFPAFVSETDLLSKKEKKMIGYDTADMLNKQRKAWYFEMVTQIPNVYFSYASEGLTEGYYPSAFLEEILRVLPVREWVVNDLLKQPYAYAFDKVISKEAYDDYVLYGTRSDVLTTLYPQVKDTIKRFDNRFTGLGIETLQRVVKVPLKLSFSRLNIYFSCKFRFLLESVLNVEPFEEHLALDLGNYFHRVLEQGLLEETIDDAFYDRVLAEIFSGRSDISAKTMYFMRESKRVVQAVLDEISAQHSRSSYDVVDRERRYEKKYDKAVLTGIIDKVLKRETEKGLGVVLLDYKTGKPTLQLKHAIYGLNAQLLFYVILYLDATQGDVREISGFYEQTLLKSKQILQPDQSDEVLFKDALKWKGYTVNHVDEVLQIDHDAVEDSFIQGMRFKRDGDFYKSVKRYETDDLALLVEHLEALIETAIDHILAGDFAIDPKRDEKHKDLSCTYCPFNDVCYKRADDYQTVEIPADEETLFAWLKRHREGL